VADSVSSFGYPVLGQIRARRAEEAQGGLGHEGDGPQGNGKLAVENTGEAPAETGHGAICVVLEN
jgi:hypothetical protein